MSRELLVMATGDVFLDLENGATAFRHLTPVLERADLVFGNCEGVYSDRGKPEPVLVQGGYGGAPRERGGMLGTVPFQVMTLANNRTVDGGYIGLLDTIEVLHEQDVATTGAGRDLAEATCAALLERRGRTVAFLGFASSFPVGYEARASRPGIAPLRIDTFYRDPRPPCNDPEVITVPVAADLRLLHESLAKAKKESDHVVIGFHQETDWKVRRDTLQDSEISTARDAVDHGADAVICAQHACLRGMEIYRGKPIFYGLGALMHHVHRGAARPVGDHESIADAGQESYLYWPHDRPDTRVSGIAMVWFDGPDVRAGFVPAMMLPDGSTEPLRGDDSRADDVRKHLQRINADQGFDVRWVDDDFAGWRLLRMESGSR